MSGYPEFLILMLFVIVVEILHVDDFFLFYFHLNALFACFFEIGRVSGVFRNYMFASLPSEFHFFEAI